MSTYNYSSYGTAYGQQYGQQYNAQQSTSGYAPQYGQSAYSTAGSSTSVTASNSFAYASAVTTTASSTNYGYSAPSTYNYNYTSDNSSTLPAYNASNTQNSVLQAFQHSWYGNPSQATVAGAQHAAATTHQSAPTTGQQATQQQAFGYNMAAQYAQMYQQQLNISSSTSTGKTPQPTTNWGNYSQSQAASIPNRAEPAKTGWGSYTGAAPTATPASQQKSTGIVLRSPMKYSQDNPIHSGYGSGNTTQTYNQNQNYKSTSSITGQGYNSSNQGYNANSHGYNNTMGQNYGTSNNYNSISTQGYSSTNFQFKSPSSGGYSNTTGYSSSSQSGFGQSYNQQNFNKGYGSNINRNDGSQMGRLPSNTGQKNPLRGQVETPFQPYQPPGGMTGQGRGVSMNNRGKGVIRPLLGRGSPIGGNANYGGPGRPGPQNGPDIPPFPQAWHSQEFDGLGPADFQRNQGAGYNDGSNRWNRGGGGRGRYSQQSQQQQRGMYNNNSRNARGTSGSNRELWSPAGKKPDGSARSSIDSKSPINVKREENEAGEKDKIPEIKSFLYAWLGSRHARPVYDIRQVGERPNMSFRCDLRVDKFPFVGVGEAANKKEAQTAAAWDFADFLIKNGDLNEVDLPPRNSRGAEEEGDFGTVKDEEESEAKKELEERNGNRRGENRKGRDQRWGNQQNYGGRGGRQHAGRGRQQQQPPQQVEIQPLMSLPLAGHPWDGPGPGHMPMGMNMPPPRPLMPPPGMNQWDDGWGFPMGPPPPHVMMMMRGHMGPPPPFMRRNQNEYWRRRDMEERMYDMKWNQGDWQNPEDVFIHQMIRNQQESERHRGRHHQMPSMEGLPGEWHSMSQSRPVVTSDDRHVMAKHSVVYPQEGELKTLHRIVNTVEQALKFLSDKFVDEDHPKEESKREEEEGDAKSDEKAEKEEDGEEKKEMEAGESDAKDDSTKKDEKQDDKRAKIKILKRPKKTPKQVDTRPRVLCGVNRVGPLAKGLLISKDDRVDLALLCGKVPTVALLDRIMSHMEEKLVEVDESFKLNVMRREEEAGFMVETVEEPFVKLFVTLTATSLRKKKDETGKKEKLEEKSMETESEKKDGSEEEENKEEEPEEPQNKENEDQEQNKEESSQVGTLPKQKMLDALACLRHTHWFQGKVADFQSCVILIRIIRDLQRRDDVWESIPEWALEVLIYNCLVSSDEHHMTPGEACRRFFEVIAGGILLPGMPGIQDPCEKETRDILDSFTEQEKEAITRSAQSHLRRVAFREIHKVLGMEKLPPTYKMMADMRQGNLIPDQSINKSEGTKDRDEKQTESNNLRKRRFEPNGNDSVAESPKRSLTDEEDTDTQQNLAELSISDEASEGRSLEEADDQKKEEESCDIKEDDSELLSKDDEHMDDDIVLSQEEEDALLEENMDS